MKSKKINKKELFFLIIIPISISAFLIFSFFPVIENYWLEVLLKTVTMIVISSILSLIMYRIRTRKQKNT